MVEETQGESSIGECALASSQIGLWRTMTSDSRREIAESDDNIE
jgi:hypothetical protein